MRSDAAKLAIHLQLTNNKKLQEARSLYKKRLKQKIEREYYQTCELRRLDLKRYKAKRRGKPILQEGPKLETVESDPIRVPRDPDLVTYDD